MNVLRNLARNLWNAIETKSAAKTPEVGAKTLHAVREQRVPAVLGLGRFRDGFDKLPAPGGAVRTTVPAGTFRPAFAPVQLRRDGFDSARRAPVDLSGGSARPQQAKAESKAALNFSASLEELGALAA